MVAPTRGTEGGMASFFRTTFAIALALAAIQTAPAHADAGKITGVGGVFIKSKDPKALAAWYRDVLGIRLENWGGAILRYDAPDHPPQLVWNAFPEKSGYFAPSTREVMLNFAVDDLDAFLAKLKVKGVTPIKREDSPDGKFAWIMDPDGTKIELWQPKGK
jgi:catechol 2,3-dioxygenase-like lactoylglutathione lyase family enzyme